VTRHAPREDRRGFSGALPSAAMQGTELPLNGRAWAYPDQACLFRQCRIAYLPKFSNLLCGVRNVGPGVAVWLPKLDAWKLSGPVE
jgi:hypothetical protein